MCLADRLNISSSVERLRTVRVPHPTEHGTEVRRRDSDDLDQRHGTPAGVQVRREHEGLVAGGRHPLPVRLFQIPRRSFQATEAPAGAGVDDRWRVGGSRDDEGV